MTPPRTLVGTLANWGWLRQPRIRRVLFAVLIGLFTLLTFFPERYRAAVTLTPSDPTKLGFNPSQMQLYAINSVFGDHAALEVALRVSRSVYVRNAVIDKAKLLERRPGTNRLQLHRWLQDQMTILSLRGGIVQFEIRLKDADLARDIVAEYANATQAQLARISRMQTAYKRDVLVELVTDASNRLAQARGAFDTFRLRTNSPLPQDSLQAVASRIPALETAIKAKEIELAAARQFGTDQNMKVQQLLVELAGLRRQLAQVKERSPASENTVGRAVAASAQGERLQRELQIAQILYENYRRFLDGTSVEDLTSTANVRILEPAYVDTERQIDYRFLSLALALALLWAAIEFYRLRPALGAPLAVSKTHA